MKSLAHSMTAGLLSLALAGAAITPALAGAPEPARITIDTVGIDLATPAGQQMLDRRIVRAVQAVCGSAGPQTGTRVQSQAVRACIAKARAEAKQQVAALTATPQRGG